GDRPGVTRANQWVKISPYLELLDTPGLLWPRLDDARAAQRLAYIGTIRDEVMDQQQLAILLLQDLLAVCPKVVQQRFKLKTIDQVGLPLLEAVCMGRGFLMSGGVCDTERGAAVILDEFRAGRMGRITLEYAPNTRKEVRHAQESDGEAQTDQ
ncbi:MAG: ribosome biogenesis GTPase YlqF, partial [Clostridia bacterium]